MKTLTLIVLLITNHFCFAQDNSDIVSDTIIIDYFNKNEKNIKVKKYLDENFNIHPQEESFDRKGRLRECSYYNHGQLLLSISYNRKRIAKKNNGVRIDYTESNFQYEVDSSNLYSELVNYSDANGLRQGIWKSKEIIKGPFGMIYNVLYTIGKYVDGVKQGEWKYYYYYGRQLYMIANYKNDMLEGVLKFHEYSGEVTVEYECNDNKKNGMFKTYYKDGSKHIVGTLSNNNFVGEYFEYKKSGKIKKYIKDSLEEHPYE